MIGGVVDKVTIVLLTPVSAAWFSTSSLSQLSVLGKYRANAGQYWPGTHPMLNIYWVCCQILSVAERCLLLLHYHISMLCQDVLALERLYLTV